MCPQLWLQFIKWVLLTFLGNSADMIFIFSIRKVAEGLTVPGILENWSNLKPVIMEEWGENRDALIDLFGKVRDQWMDEDITTWIGANRYYGQAFQIESMPCFQITMDKATIKIWPLLFGSFRFLCLSSSILIFQLTFTLYWGGVRLRASWEFMNL